MRKSKPTVNAETTADRLHRLAAETTAATSPSGGPAPEPVSRDSDRREQPLRKDSALSDVGAALVEQGRLLKAWRESHAGADPTADDKQFWAAYAALLEHRVPGVVEAE